MRLLLLLNTPVSGVAAAHALATATVLASAALGGSAAATSAATASSTATIIIEGSTAASSSATASFSLSGFSGDDLVDAIEALVQAQLVATGVLTWFGADKAPPGQALPYAEIEDFDEVPDDWMNDDPDGIASYDDYADIPINIYASTKFAAKALGRQLASLLTDAPLTFLDGDLLYLRRGPKGTASLDPDPAPRGGDCWALNVIFHAITAKTT